MTFFRLGDGLKIINLLLCVVILSAPALSQMSHAEPDADFHIWLNDLKTEALTKGIRQETLDAALSNVKILKRVIQKDRNQPEVKQTYAQYLQQRVSDWRKDKGQQVFKRYGLELNAASKKYGVQPHFIAAIWGIETNYGTVPLTYSVFDALATLAYDPRRAKRFRGELFAALEIMDKGYASYDLLKGSWAGAMGQPQFMPVNYLKYAVDMDGNDYPDIWHSKADILGSIANYLNAHGWRSDQTWGRKVRLPTGGESTLKAPQNEGLAPEKQCASFKSLGPWRDIADWQALGVRRMNGGDLPQAGIPAALILADDGDNEGYLVYYNFCAIMRYNPSFKYALSVGLLSDALKDAANLSTLTKPSLPE